MCKKVMLAVLVISVTMSGLVLSQGAVAKGKHDSVCVQTAKKMHSACKADNRDDLDTVLANCLNILDGDESRDCAHEARDSRKEEDKTCKDVRAAREDACEILAEQAYDPDPLLDPGITFVDPDDVGVDDVDEGEYFDYDPNPYVSIAAGHTFVLRAGEEEEELVVVHVTDDSREIQGVMCRVVVDVAVEVEEDGDEVDRNTGRRPKGR